MRRLMTQARLHADPPTEFTIAFQPIVDTRSGLSVFAYEALVRGPRSSLETEGASSVFARIPAYDAIAFDAACRERAVRMAAALGFRCRLSLNVSPKALCDYRYGLHTTLRVAQRVGLPAECLIFEMTENDPIADTARLGRWIASARRRGVRIALDDLGAGYAGLGNLLRLRPDIVKVDMELVRGIDSDRSRQALVKGIVEACRAFNCEVISEGVETKAEYAMLRSLGIGLMQGYLFAKPGLETLPEVIHPFSHVESDLDGHHETEGRSYVH